MQYGRGEFSWRKFRGTENPADMMTKHLDQKNLDTLLQRINLEIFDVGFLRATFFLAVFLPVTFFFVALATVRCSLARDLTERPCRRNSCGYTARHEA